ncbi:MAG TPA: recombination-associated protein RdgC, partial [Burkholderiales bacterium]
MIYRLGEHFSLSQAEVEQGLQAAQFTDCLPSQEKSMGWVSPRGEEHGALVEAVAGQWIMRFKVESRMLPMSVVRRKAEERMAKIEEITGRKPGKKQAREIREDTFIQLLPQAFTKQSSTNVWIDPEAKLLVLDVGSQGKADELLTSLFKAVAGLTATPLATASSPAASMAMWLSGKLSPGGFDVDRECELKSTDDMQSVVKYARHHLDIAEIRQHVEAGKMPTRLAMAYEGRVSFTLTDTLQLKKIKFLEGVFSSEVPEEDRFDTDTA